MREIQKNHQRTKKNHVITCKISVGCQCLDVGDGGPQGLAIYRKLHEQSRPSARPGRRDKTGERKEESERVF